MLQSPNFLFRLEETANAQWKPYATASRLSYALWDTMPDSALLESAARGELFIFTGPSPACASAGELAAAAMLAGGDNRTTTHSVGLFPARRFSTKVETTFPSTRASHESNGSVKSCENFSFPTIT